MRPVKGRVDQQLFQYRDEAGKVRDVKSTDVNRYLQEITKEDITAKDFRTWAAGRSMVKALQKQGIATSQVDAERKISTAIKAVAHQLGNTIAVCRKSYIHPALLEAYRTHSASWLFRLTPRPKGKSNPGFQSNEAAVARLLQQNARAK